MYETLLFLHVLSAFALVAGVVMQSALVLGAAIGRGTLALASRLTEIGGTAVLVFGLWIVFKEDVYDITNGWVLGAIALWVVAVGTGSAAGRGVPAEGELRVEGRAVALHWVAAAALIGILVLMIWKPGV